MLSQLVLDLEVVRSLVSQNGQKIGKIETDIINKSQENQNAHQDIEGKHSQQPFSEVGRRCLFLSVSDRHWSMLASDIGDILC